MIEETPDRPEPQIPRKLSEWEELLGDLTPDERSLAEKARFHLQSGNAHEICARLFLGQLASKLSAKPGSYGKGRIERFAEQNLISTALAYQAKRLVERLPDALVEQLVRRGEEKTAPFHASLSHLVALAEHPELPDDEKERYAWCKTILARIVNEQLSVAKTRKLLASGSQVSGSPETESAEDTPSGATSCKPVTEVIRPFRKHLEDEIRFAENWTDRLLASAKSCPIDQVPTAMRSIGRIRSKYLKRHHRTLAAIEGAEQTLKEKQVG